MPVKYLLLWAVLGGASVAQAVEELPSLEMLEFLASDASQEDMWLELELAEPSAEAGPEVSTTETEHE